MKNALFDVSLATLLACRQASPGGDGRVCAWMVFAVLALALLATLAA